MNDCRCRDSYDAAVDVVILDTGARRSFLSCEAAVNLSVPAQVGSWPISGKHSVIDPRRKVLPALANETGKDETFHKRTLRSLLLFGQDHLPLASALTSIDNAATCSMRASPSPVDGTEYYSWTQASCC